MDAHISTLAGQLRHWSLHDPQRCFVVSPETGLELSHGGLAAFAVGLDRLLSARGVPRGATVAFYLENGLSAMALFLATMAAGRVVAPLNLLSQRAALGWVLAHSECRILFTSPEQYPRVREAVAQDDRLQGLAIEVVDPDRLDWLMEAGERAEFPLALVEASAAEDVALLMYTSGTTGTPKGALLSHANLLHASRSVRDWHGLTREDRVLSALPLYHINGQVIATVTPFLSGGSLVAPRKFSVSHWWDAVQAHRCTWINMVPTIIAYLLHASDHAPRESLRALGQGVRFGRSASAPLPPEHHRAFEERFGLPVIEAMGMTESASVVFCNPMPPRARKYGTPGLALAVTAKVVDPQGQAVPDGTQGEIWLRGANVMRGYFKAPEQTASALTADGWLRSGDLGHRDADGYFFITGRLKELIIKGGENIAPREIDEVLLRHPAVAEAAAVGVPDPDYGQDILACVVLREGAQATPQELRAFCEAELGRYKSPREIRLMQDLPKGPSGKIQRLKLVT